jgi:vitamin B12 transporter
MSKKIAVSILTAVALTQVASAKEEFEVKITSATKSEQSIKDVTANMTVITSTQLEERHITSVIDALRNFANVPIAQSGGIGQQSSFFLRGFSSGNALVLIDGVSYNDPTGTEGQAQLEHLMINDIERIEIIKGAQSGVWGANAVAGVINIITKKATEKLAVNANIEFGSKNSQKYALSASQKVGALSYYLGANYLSTDGISAQTLNKNNPDNYEADPYKNRTLNAKLGYELDGKNSVNFTLTDIYAKCAYDSWGAPDSTGYETTQKNRLYAIGFEHKLNGTSFVSLKHENTSFLKEDPKGWTKRFEGVTSKNSVMTKLGYMGESFVIAGVDKANSKDRTNDRKQDSSAIFATNSNKLGSFILTESLRKDYFDAFEDKATGKVGAKYNISNDLSVSANAGTAYKAPSLSQLFDPTYGNKNLKPESTVSTDVSAEYKRLKVTYFDNHVTDLISYDPTTYINTQVSGTSRIKGLEVAYSHTVGESVLLSFSGTQLSAKDQDGNDLQRRADKIANASVDYYGISKLHISLGANYVGTRYDDLAKTKQTGRYTTINTVANYKLSKQVKLYAKVENLTDKRYQEVDGYGTQGRSLYVGVNAKF